MKIYVRVYEDGFGDTAWFNDYGDEAYLIDGKELFVEGTWGRDDYLRGTPFNTFKKVKRAAREAISLMESDGAAGKVTASFWRYLNGKLVETKFTRDGKIKH